MHGREEDSVRESDAADVLDESRVGVEVACCADASGRAGERGANRDCNDGLGRHHQKNPPKFSGPEQLISAYPLSVEG